MRGPILSRDDWRAAYRALRVLARDNFKRGKNVTLLSIMHGGTYWTVYRDAVARPYAETRVYPSIIRDRAPTSRIAHELAWAAEYRRRAIAAGRMNFAATVKPREIEAARACIADARSIRLSASAFYGVTA